MLIVSRLAPSPSVNRMPQQRCCWGSLRARDPAGRQAGDDRRGCAEGIRKSCRLELRGLAEAGQRADATPFIAFMLTA